MGQMQGGHTVEKKKKFSFIREEITEARYIPTRGDALGRDMNDVAESYSEQLLMLQQMRFEKSYVCKKVCKRYIEVYELFSSIPNRWH